MAGCARVQVRRAFGFGVIVPAQMGGRHHPLRVTRRGSAAPPAATQRSRPGSPMTPEDERDLAAMMALVLDQVPDDPGSRRQAVIAVTTKPDRQVVQRPPPQARVDHRPCLLERIDDLARRTRSGLVVLPSGIAEGKAGYRRAFDAEQVAHGCIALAKNVVEPEGARPSHVAGDLPDGPPVRGRSKGELLGLQVAQGVQEQTLVVGPAGVERLEGDDALRHGAAQYPATVPDLVAGHHPPRGHAAGSAATSSCSAAAAGSVSTNRP